MSDISKIKEVFKYIDTSLGKLIVELEKQPEPLENVLMVLLDHARVAKSNLRKIVIELEGQVGLIPKNCDDINLVAQVLSDVYKLRRACIRDLDTLLDRIMRAALRDTKAAVVKGSRIYLEGSAIKSDSIDNIKLHLIDINKQSINLMEKVTSIEIIQANFSVFKENLKITDLIKDVNAVNVQSQFKLDINNLINDINGKATEVGGKIKVFKDKANKDFKFVDLEESKKLIANGASYLEEFDRKLAGLILQGMIIDDNLSKLALNLAIKTLQPSVNILYKIYESVYEGFNSLAKYLIKDSSALQGLRLILRPDIYDRLNVLMKPSVDSNHVINVLKNERDNLKSILDNCGEIDGLKWSDIPSDNKLNIWKEAIIKANKLKDDWQNRNPVIIEIGKDLIEVFEALSHGNLSGLVSFDNIEEELKTGLLGLIPTSLSYSYNWGTLLSSFPAEKPIFSMNNNDKSKKDFQIDVIGKLDLVTQGREVSVASHLMPFTIKLFPEFEAITINFKGAKFTSDSNGTKFDIKVEKVIIGEKLKFIEQLAKLLNPDNGPYVVFNPSPPSVEAGYRLNVGSINLGTLNFLNVNLNVACILPFDSNPALFQFGLSSRENPFLIVSTPYGGGGFVTIRAQATVLVYISVGFEFGAVVPLNFGPLHGHGRVTSGVYIIQRSKENTQVTAFVQAMGEASIACFGISVCLRVDLNMDGNGNLVGSASYTFSFRIGFFKVSYGFSVSYTIRGGKEISAPKNVSLLAEAQSIRDKCNDENVKTCFSNICKNKKIEINDGLIVGCVNERNEWDKYVQLFALKELGLGE